MILRDNLLMFLGFLQEFKTTGTAFNSSPWAARALAQPMKSALGPKNILEIGAGTGPVTVEIIKEMNENDSLTIVECNSTFMKALKERVLALPEYQQHKNRISFFEGFVQDLPEGTKYDIMICALPFLNFEKELVEDIFKKFSRLGKEDTVLTYYEYIGLRHIGKVVSKERKERVRKLEKFFKDVVHSRLITRKRVWRNVLPIYIYTMNLPPIEQAGHRDAGQGTATTGVAR